MSVQRKKIYCQCPEAVYDDDATEIDTVIDDLDDLDDLDDGDVEEENNEDEEDRQYTTLVLAAAEMALLKRYCTSSLSIAQSCCCCCCNEGRPNALLDTLAPPPEFWEALCDLFA